MKYQTYIFDLYGTLVDIKTDEAKASVWKKFSLFLAAQGAMYSWKELKVQYGILIREEEKCLLKKWRKQYPDIEKKDIEICLDKVIAKLYRAKGVKPGKQLVEHTMHAFRAITMEKLRLFDGAEELLQRLKKEGKKVYLLSNAQASFTAPEMKLLGIEPYFDDIFFSSDLAVKKPGSYFYDALFRKHNIEKKTAVMVGNDRFADVQGALDYGLEAIYLHTEQSTPFEGELPKGCVQVKCLLDIVQIER